MDVNSERQMASILDQSRRASMSKVRFEQLEMFGRTFPLPTIHRHLYVATKTVETVEVLDLEVLARTSRLRIRGESSSPLCAF